MKQSIHTKLGSLFLLAVLVPAVTPVTALAQSDPRPTSARDRLRQRYDRSRQGGDDIAEEIRKIRSDDPAVRLEAVRTLGASDDPKAVEQLMGAASDSDMRVKIKAIDELGNRMAKEATPMLVQQLFLRETEAFVQQRVLAALGKIADPRSTRPICEFLERDLDSSTRGTAVFALGEIGDETAFDVLTELAENGNDPTVSRLAGEAMRKIEHKAPPPLDLPVLAEDRRR
jgi:HEAT repeat protein